MLQRILGNAAALAVGGAVAQIAFIAVEIAIARSFSESEYGIFATVQAVALTGLILVDFGMHWWAIESGSKSPAKIPSLLGTTMLMRVVSFLVLWPAAILLLQATGYDAETVGFFAVFFVFSLTMALQDSLAAAHTAEQRMLTNAVFQGGVALTVALFVGGAILLGAELITVAYCYVAGGALVTAAWIALSRKRWRPKVVLAEVRSIVAGSYLYGLTGLLVHVFRKGDILLLSALGSMSQVGIYAAASKLLDLAYKIPYLGSLVVSPEMFKQNATDPDQFQRSADFYVRFNSILGITLALVIFYCSEIIVALLFGSQYEDSAALLKILSASFGLKFIHHATQTILTTQLKHRERTRALFIATICGIIGHILLIPRMGAVGAAIAVILSECLLTVLYIAGVSVARMRIILASRIASTIAAAAAVVLTISIGEIRGIPAAIVAVILFASACLLARIVKWSEVRELAAGLRR